MVYNNVEESTRVNTGKAPVSSRLLWMLFDRKTIIGSLEQLQRTESGLLFILQLISMYVLVDIL